MKEKDKYWQSTREGIPEATRKISNEYLLSLKLVNKAEATITKYLGKVPVTTRILSKA